MLQTVRVQQPTGAGPPSHGSSHLPQNLLFPMSGVPRSGASPRNMNVPTEGNKGQSGFDAVKNTAWHLAAWGLRAVVASTENLSALISGDLPPRPMRWYCGVRAARHVRGAKFAKKKKESRWVPLELSWKRLWSWKPGRQASVDDPPTPAAWKGNRKSDGLKHQHGQWRDGRPELDWRGIDRKEHRGHTSVNGKCGCRCGWKRERRPNRAQPDRPAPA